MKKFDGHFYIGDRITVYGDNAMHYGVTIWTRKFGYICFRLPLKSCGKWWPLYLYFSPNGTTNRSTFLLGKEFSKTEKWQAKARRRCLGHNFSYKNEKNEAICNVISSKTKNIFDNYWKNMTSRSEKKWIKNDKNGGVLPLFEDLLVILSFFTPFFISMEIYI